MKFPKQATAQAWGALGWNDYAATHNAIVTSGRSIPLRLARWNGKLEAYLPTAFEQNFFYTCGVEDCMLYLRGRITTVAPAQKFTESKVHPLLYPVPCDWCGKAIELASLLCNAALLTNHFCCEACVGLKLKAVIASDICLSDMFSKPPYRKDVPIPEDEEEFGLHFIQVPAFGITDSFDEEVYVAERKPVARPMPSA